MEQKRVEKPYVYKLGLTAFLIFKRYYFRIAIYVCERANFYRLIRSLGTEKLTLNHLYRGKMYSV